MNSLYFVQPMDVKQQVLNAEKMIRGYVRETPLTHSHYLSQMCRGHVHLKLENLQVTGSFKVRGAMNKLLSLTPQQRKSGVVAASSGNHGVAVAYGLSMLETTGIIFIPEDASPTKVDAIRRYGADVRFHGSDCAIAEAFAREYAKENNMVYISPYNDPQIIGGQGTIGIELKRQLESIHAILIALGGGGLISGIAGYLKSVNTDVTIIGCSPENSPVMVESIRAGKILQMESKPTLSDGTTGGIEPGAVTFGLCQEFVDDYVLVSEDEIKKAVKLFIETHHMLIEGAAGVAVASFLKMKGGFSDKNVVIIICGANIGLESLKMILQ